MASRTGQGQRDAADTVEEGAAVEFGWQVLIGVSCSNRCCSNSYYFSRNILLFTTYRIMSCIR